jgi:hypothetical protein
MDLYARNAVRSAKIHLNALYLKERLDLTTLVRIEDQAIAPTLVVRILGIWLDSRLP